MHKDMNRASGPSWAQLRSWWAPWDALWQALIGSWRWAIARRSEHLDDATLRDLGLNRSELSSCRAEADGLVEVTRRRLIEQHGSHL